MRIEYSLTPDDLVATLRHIGRTSSLARSIRRKQYVFGGAVVLIAMVAMGIIVRAPVSIVLASVAVGLGLFGSITYVLTVLCQRWALRNFAKPENQRGVVGAHVMLLEAGQLIDRSEVNENRYQWIGVERIERTADYLLFWVTAASAHVIPLRAFSSTSDAEAFEGYARSLHVAGSASPPSR